MREWEKTIRIGGTLKVSKLTYVKLHTNAGCCPSLCLCRPQFQHSRTCQTHYCESLKSYSLRLYILTCKMEIVIPTSTELVGEKDNMLKWAHSRCSTNMGGSIRQWKGRLNLKSEIIRQVPDVYLSYQMLHNILFL